MSFAFSSQPTFANRPGISKGEQGFLEVMSHAYDYGITNNDSTSEGVVLEEQWQPIIDIMNEKRDILQDKSLSNKNYYTPYLRNLYPDKVTASNENKPYFLGKFRNPGTYFTIGIFDNEGQKINYDREANQIINTIKQNPEIFPELQNVNLETIYENAKQTAINKRQIYNESVEKTPGASGAIARFTGEMGAAGTDPVNLGSMLIGGAGKNLFGLILNNALVGAASEALIQTKVKDWYETLGLDYTSEQFWKQVALGGVLGGAMPVAFRLGGKTITLTSDQVKKGVQAFKGTKVVNKNEVTAVENAVARSEDAINSNPLKDDIEHGERLAEANRSFESAESPNMSDTPNSPIVEKTIFESQTSDTIGVRFNPDEIEVDAKTFQFKEGADNQGVTDRLAGVDTWDDVFSGQIVVYEFLNGKQFIADGHQRLALAKKVKAQGKDVTLIGTKLREVDGITPAMARVMAARKNIAEGTGSYADAAKIAREDPVAFKQSIPPRSALARIARSLVNLSDEDFGLVINGVVDARYASVVGRLIPNDKGLQNAALRVLSKNTPDNEFQAEAIVRQVIEAGYEKQKSGTLFGDEVISESFFTERSKILDQSIKILRQDKNAFDSLVRNADRIEGEGNKLVNAANLDRASQDSQAIEMLTKLANRKGNLSDALTEAAKVARETGNYSNSSRGFVEAVRNAIRDGDFQNIRIDNVGRTFNDSAQVGKATDEPGQQLDNFSEPNGRGASQQADQLEEEFFGEVVDQTSLNKYDSNIESSIDASSKINEDLDTQIPTEIVDDGQGGVTARTQSINELKEEFAQDQRMLDRLEGCVK